MAFYIILYSFRTILCVSHELSFHFPWASCGKCPASNEQSFSFPMGCLWVTSGEFALWKLRRGWHWWTRWEACTAGAVLRQLPAIDPSGQIRGDLSLPGPPHSCRGHGWRGRDSSACHSPAGHTVDVYVSTHLSPSEQGARSAAHALGTH